MIEWKIIDSKTQKSSNTGSQIAKKGRKKGGTEGAARRQSRVTNFGNPSYKVRRVGGDSSFMLRRGNKVFSERFLRHDTIL